MCTGRHRRAKEYAFTIQTLLAVSGCLFGFTHVVKASANNNHLNSKCRREGVDHWRQWLEPSKWMRWIRDEKEVHHPSQRVTEFINGKHHSPTTAHPNQRVTRPSSQAQQPQLVAVSLNHPSMPTNAALASLHEGKADPILLSTAGITAFTIIGLCVCCGLCAVCITNCDSHQEWQEWFLWHNSWYRDAAEQEQRQAKVHHHHGDERHHVMAHEIRKESKMGKAGLDQTRTKRLESKRTESKRSESSRTESKETVPTELSPRSSRLHSEKMDSLSPNSSRLNSERMESKRMSSKGASPSMQYALGVK